MAWPTGEDYQTAIQGARNCFKDSELKGGRPELDKLGLPKPRSGSYAVAFKVECASNAFAVRCFLSDSANRQRRYLHISEHLTKARLPFTVAFEYHRDGILVNGQWRPILKMEWVQGESLGSYVAKHVGDSNRMSELAARWAELAKALASAGLAHGDLQHGNVLVMPNGQIKLIDYDGMYVPALAGHRSEELGHRNFQHPRRTDLDFGPSLDHFSEWLIFISLRLLVLDPQLWTTLGGGDECLLFRKADLVQPDTSLAFRTLARASDKRVGSLGRELLALLSFEPLFVPPLDPATAWRDSSYSPTPQSSTSTAVDGAWIVDHLPAKSPALGQQELAPAESDATWVHDHQVQEFSAERFSNSVYFERAVILSGITLVGCTYHFYRGWMLTSVGVLGITSTLLIALRYNMQAVVARSRIARRTIDQLHSESSALRKSLSRLKQDIASRNTELQARIRILASERKELELAEHNDGSSLRATLKSTLLSINETRGKIDKNAADELSQARADLGTQLHLVQQNIARCDPALLRELGAALTSLQQAHVSCTLNNAVLSEGSIPGIGPGLRATLRSAGISTAFNITRRGVSGIPGIGPARQNDLLAWARQIEANAMASRPTILSYELDARIRSRFSVERSTLEQQERALLRRLTEVEQPILERQNNLRGALAEQERRAQDSTGKGLADIRMRHAPKYLENDAQVAQVRAERASQVAELQLQVDQLLGQETALKWRVARAQTAHTAFRYVSLLRYVGRVLAFPSR